MFFAQLGVRNVQSYSNNMYICRRMKKTGILVTALLMGGTLQAQQAQVTLDKGLTITSADEKYSITVKPRLSNLIEADWDNDGHHAGTDLVVNKARLALSGHVFSKQLTYSLQFGFSKGDTKSPLANHTNIIRNAIIYYQPSPAWKFGFGQAKINANRAHMNSSQNLEFTSRSITDGAFELDRDYGIFLEHNRHLGGSADWKFLGSITSGEGRNYGKSANSGLAYTARVELYPFGKFTATSEGDLKGEEHPHLMVGVAVSYNDRAVRTGGQGGNLWVDGGTRSMKGYFADMVFKYQGFALAADVMGRNADTPVVDKQYIYKGWGYNVQGSYTWQGKWALALRNANLFPAEEIRPLVGYKTSNQSTLAVTRYIVDHRVKIGADVSYTHRSEATEVYNRWQLRCVAELGF